jgi:hypothetical protein
MLGMLAQYEEMTRRQAPKNIHEPYWALTIQLGVALTQAALAWGEDAVATLTELQAGNESSGIRQPTS